MTGGVLRAERAMYWEPPDAHEALAGRSARRGLSWLPVVVIVAAQAYLSARLVHLSPASPDESLYIYAGHQLIHELWHGGGSPYYETYFSGAPDLYPILAAMADDFGGLVAVRLMSLVFTLVAAGLLFATTRRMFGYWPAVTATALFAGLGVTDGVGVLATFDSLSLLLIAAAAYCGVRAAEGRQTAARWLLLIPVVLLAANAVKYASILFDPVVIGLAALQLEREGWRRVAQRLVALSAATAMLLLVSALLAGGAYIEGIMYTTLNRPTGVQPAFAVLKTDGPVELIRESWDYIGAVVTIGVLAVPIAFFSRDERRKTFTLALLVVAGMLVTIEAIHLRTDMSMSKHDDFGAWFTSMAAGYALTRLAQITFRRHVKVLLAVVSTTIAVLCGLCYSDSTLVGDQSTSWSALLPTYAYLRPYLELPSGRDLLGSQLASQIIYVDDPGIRWYQYSDDLYIKYPIAGRGGNASGSISGAACWAVRPGCMYLEGSAGYTAAIRAHWFSLISMLGSDGTSQDAAIVAAVKSTPGYVLLTTSGGAPTWIYAPDYGGTTRAVVPAGGYSHDVRAG